MWLALWMVQLDSHRTLRVSSSSSAIRSVERDPPCMHSLQGRKHSALDWVVVSAYLERMKDRTRKTQTRRRQKSVVSANLPLSDVDRRILRIMQADGRA